MRRFTTAITAAALAMSMALSLNGGTAQAATPGYDSAYQFESAFLTVKPADSGTFSVFFANTGTTSWTAGSGSQVNLGVCAADKVTCNVVSANSAWANGWLSSTAYATHTKTVVVPGDFSAFTYNIKVPAGTGAGTFRFNGDLVLGSTGDRIHPEGYYQDASVTGAAGGAALSITEPFASNVDNQISTNVPGNGQHTFNVSTTLTGTMSFIIIDSANAGLNSDGSFSFCDIDQNQRGDTTVPGRGSDTTFFTSVNGRSISQSNTIINEPIPSSGAMTVQVDSATKNDRIRVVAWQDLNGNGQIDLSGAGDINCDAFTAYSTADGALTVGARKWYFPAEATFGQYFGGGTCSSYIGNDGLTQTNGGPVYRSDTANQVFSAGSKPRAIPAGSATSVHYDTAGNSYASIQKYKYDSNDIFRINGVQVTLAQFKSSLTASYTGGGDTLGINYSVDPAGISEFNICSNVGATAPDFDSVAIGNFDSGSQAEDVRLTFTAPSGNSVTSYNLQRAVDTSGAVNACTTKGQPNDASNTNFSTIAALTVAAGKQGTFTDFDRPVPSGNCYRLQVTDPTTGLTDFSDNPASAPVTGGTGDNVAPTSSEAALTKSSGFGSTLDTGDKLEFIFIDMGPGSTGQMSVAANSVIRVTDSDCGPATNAGPAACGGNTSNTVADITCGSNATCELNTAKTTLTVTMTSNPTIVSSGSTPNVQYRIVVTDSSGITDLSGNTWNLSGSTDRLVCAPGETAAQNPQCP
jgi:hypothetical protein